MSRGRCVGDTKTFPETAAIRNESLWGGHSAGAQLAALICTDVRYLKTEGVSFEALKGCIAVDGATYELPKAIMNAETRRTIYGDQRRELVRKTNGPLGLRALAVLWDCVS